MKPPERMIEMCERVEYYNNNPSCILTLHITCSTWHSIRQSRLRWLTLEMHLAKTFMIVLLKRTALTQSSTFP